MAYPRIIPHSDGAGVIDAVGDGVDERRVGWAVWCYGAQTYRPLGTAADFVGRTRAAGGRPANGRR